MKCPICGFDNLDIACFCIKCGARIDGKIPCPKCREYIDNSLMKCPNCGRHIPHINEVQVKHNFEASARKEGISKIFNNVSTFITLFLLIFMITFTLPLNIDFFNTFTNFSKLDNVEQVLTIIRFVFKLIGILVTILFSIFGIKSCAKAFKNKNLIVDAYKYLAIAFASKLFTTVFLISSYQIISFSKFDICSLFLLLLVVVHFLICLGFDCFLHFKRGQISIFIARVILAVGLILPILILCSLAIPYFKNEGVIYHFVFILNSLQPNIHNFNFVTLFIVNLCSTILLFLLISFCFSFVVYFITSYFRGMSKYKRYRIVFYFLVIIMSIFAIGYLISSIVEFYLFNSYFGGNYVYSLLPIVVFISSILLVGVAIATFNIYNRYNRRSLLEANTTHIN